VYGLPVLTQVHRTMPNITKLAENTAKLSRRARAWNSTDVNRATLILTEINKHPLIKF